MTRTHTYAILEVSNTTFDEIKGKLVAAGYIRANETTIDMSGIALERQADIIDTVETTPGHFEPKVVMATADAPAQDLASDEANMSPAIRRRLGYDVLDAHYNRRG